MNRLQEAHAEGVEEVSPLEAQSVIFHALDTHGLKRPVSHVQRDLDNLYSPPVQRFGQLASEVQARRRRRNRPALAREDRLVPVAIACLVGSLDIRRQRHMTDLVDDLVDG